MTDRIIKRETDETHNFDWVWFQIGNGTYMAKVHGDDVWAIHRTFKKAPYRWLSPREEFRVATAMKKLLGDEEFAAMAAADEA